MKLKIISKHRKKDRYQIAYIENGKSTTKHVSGDHLQKVKDSRKYEVEG